VGYGPHKVPTAVPHASTVFVHRSGHCESRVHSHCNRTTVRYSVFNLSLFCQCVISQSEKSRAPLNLRARLRAHSLYATFRRYLRDTAVRSDSRLVRHAPVTFGFEWNLLSTPPRRTEPRWECRGFVKVRLRFEFVRPDIERVRQALDSRSILFEPVRLTSIRVRPALDSTFDLG
jgi:hypothetical protein